MYSMGVAQKNKRKIAVNDRSFFWQVIDSLPGCALQVISEDKHFLVQYPLGTQYPYCLLKVVGKEFPGLPAAGRCVVRIHCPQFGSADIATPETVRQLIDWCFSTTKKVILVDILGKPLPGQGRELRQ